MEHHFNVDIAKEYGIHCAIMLNNLQYWIAKNEANGLHQHDGMYWTYNSKKAMSSLFPYMTERQIIYAMEKLIAEGLVVKGNYNQSTYDHTLWYAITKKGYSILQNCQNDLTMVSERFDNGVKSILTTNNIYNNTNNKQQIENPNNKHKENVEIYTNLSQSVQDAIKSWLEYKRERRQNYKESGLNALLKDIKNKAETYGDKVVVDAITYCMSQNYSGIFYDKVIPTQPQKPLIQGHTIRNGIEYNSVGQPYNPNYNRYGDD